MSVTPTSLRATLNERRARFTFERTLCTRCGKTEDRETTGGDPATALPDGWSLVTVAQSTTYPTTPEQEARLEVRAEILCDVCTDRQYALLNEVNIWRTR